jgi:hypothetical protein
MTPGADATERNVATSGPIAIFTKSVPTLLLRQKQKRV